MSKHIYSDKNGYRVRINQDRFTFNSPVIKHLETAIELRDLMVRIYDERKHKETEERSSVTTDAKTLMMLYNNKHDDWY